LVNTVVIITIIGEIYRLSQLRIYAYIR